MQTKSATPQNLPVPLWGGGWCEEMAPAIPFWVHSELEHPLTGTCIAFTGGPCWHVQPHPLICLCYHSFFARFLLGLPALTQLLSWECFTLLCPGQSWGRPSLGHPQWYGRNPKQLLQNHQEKWDMGIPGFFCHKGGMRVVWTHAAEGNPGR